MPETDPRAIHELASSGHASNVSNLSLITIPFEEIKPDTITVDLIEHVQLWFLQVGATCHEDAVQYHDRSL